MITNPVKQALRNRSLTLGTWIQIGHGAVAEILASAGYDWIAVDCEHTDLAVRDVVDLSRGMETGGAVPFVRVRENDTLAIRQALDAGAMGVIVPLVNTVEQAAAAVQAAKYPPQGCRGFCFSRMNRYGLDFEAYAAEANETVAVVVMVESRQAVENIEGILGVEGIDGVFIGPYDMSGSYGVVGQTGHELVQAACRSVVEACERHGKAAGLHVVVPEPAAIRKAVADGFTFLALGVDTVFLARSARSAVEAAGSGEQA